LFTDLPQREPARVSPAAGDPLDPGTPMPLYGGPVRPSGVSAGKAIIGVVIAMVIVGNVFANAGQGHGFGWLVPVFILGFVFLRLAASRRR